MCRVLSYLGNPMLVEDLLYKPDNSFIKQTYHPIYMHLLNLAGFGLVAWDTYSYHSETPFIYKTDRLPFYDENLRNLTKKITPSCLLTHIRGVPYTEKRIVSNQNVHPFLFPGETIAFAHNGALFNFDELKYDLLDYIKPHIKIHIQGTTDSEWLYAIFLSQLEETDGKVIDAIIKTLKIIKKLREKHNLRINSPMNIFLSNGKFIIATRFVFDYGWLPINIEKFDLAHLNYHSLWYTYGEKYELVNNVYAMKGGKQRKSIIIASEPLTEDTTSWIEVPEYTLIMAEFENDEIKIRSFDINV
jgi:glutamine amidotransferase